MIIESLESNVVFLLRRLPFLTMMELLILTMNTLTIINTARVKRMDLLEYYDSRQNILDIERSTLYLLSEELKKFKKKKD